MPEAGRVALVTGATAGIGLYTALGLAQAGFRVILAGRDAARLERARRRLTDRVGAASVDTALADFASLAAVRALAEQVLAQHDKLHLLVNNAGLIVPRFERSADGYEMTVAVNHLAPFLLTNLLLDRLRGSAPARVITVASQAHRGARLDFGTWMSPADWSPLKAYGRSKLCNVLFTRALARRLDGSGVMTASLHPGIVATNIGDRAGLAGLGWRLAKPFFLSPEKGASTSLFLATEADPARFHGTYVLGRHIADPDPAARDVGLAERLWVESARLTGLTPAAAAG